LRPELTSTSSTEPPQFVATATQRLAASLERAAISPSSRQPQLDRFVEEINGVLQIVAFALAQAKPTSATPSTPADVTCDAQFAPALLKALEALQAMSTSSGSGDQGRHPPGRAPIHGLRWALIICLRLLHVLLGLARYNIAQVWTAETKGLVDGLLTVLLRLAVVRRPWPFSNTIDLCADSACLPLVCRSTPAPSRSTGKSLAS
jgi:hypothetical protein